MRWLDGITNPMDVSLSEFRELVWTGRPGMLRFMGSQRVEHDWVTELNWIIKKRGGCFPGGSDGSLSAVQKTWVQSLGWDGSLEKGRATHPSILAWRIPWTEDPGRPQFIGLQRVRQDFIPFILQIPVKFENLWKVGVWWPWQWKLASDTSSINCIVHTSCMHHLYWDQ